jgi:circadian clock protein KaiB
MTEFKLFVSGETVRSKMITAKLDSLLTAVYGKQITLLVIDVIKNHQEAQREGILVTPTLIKMTPPKKRIFGDFTNMEKVFEILGIECSPGTFN